MPCALLASLAVIAVAVQTEGTTSCPHPDEVAARLAGLLPSTAASDLPDRGRLWEEGADLVIQLETADGVVLGMRRLPRTAYSCEDLAAAVAVSLAAWESDIHPEFAPDLAARPVAARQDFDSLPGSSSLSRSWRMEIGAELGVGGSVDRPAVAGDVVMDAWLTPPGARTSLRTEVEGQSERAIALRGGRALWRRSSLGLGLERPFFGTRTVGGAVRGGLSWLGLARIAWLNLRGEGFPQNHTLGVLDPGVTAGLRWAGADEHWSFGVELAASLWPVRHEAVEGGNGDRGRLPASEVFLRMGATRLVAGSR
jgi:hypothetical protein